MPFAALRSPPLSSFLTTEATAPVDLSDSPWMMTLKVCDGLAFAEASRPGVV
jgi:hypothetical protein